MDDQSPIADGGGDFDALLNRFSSLGVASSRDELAVQFSQVVGLSIELSRFYLEASGWVLESAINLYLDASSSSAQAAPRVAHRAASDAPQRGGAEAAMLQWALEASRVEGESSGAVFSGDSMGSGSSDVDVATQRAVEQSMYGGGGVLYGVAAAAPHFNAFAGEGARGQPTAFGAGSSAPVFNFAAPLPTIAFGGGATGSAFSLGVSSMGFAGAQLASPPAGAGAPSLAPTPNSDGMNE